MKNQKEFKPYIPADKVVPELTVSAIVTGIILSVVFGAANAYLGLRVGMTVSSSIPAAVVSMGILRFVLGKNSILENNMVQTIGSSGESLAAGAIFTLPALFLWAKEGIIESPGLLEITLISLLGGLLGIFFMIPLRNALIVKEHGVLPYPEGTACAQVLLAGENGGSKASLVFAGMGLSGLFKLVIDGFKLASGTVAFYVKGFAGQIGTQVYPAVLSVGYICGAKVSSYMFAGGVLSWLVLIPLIVFFGGDASLNPGEGIGALFMTEGAEGIWRTYIRYIGAGALATGGIVSLLKSLPVIVSTFFDAIKKLRGRGEEAGIRTGKDISIRVVVVAVFVLTLLLWIIPAVPVSLSGAFLVVLLGFFFATVSARMVGLVGSSNNPISGMVIATLLIATVTLKLSGQSGPEGMISAISIGSVICIITALAGDTSQDLKTGYLLGATPKKQQVAEIIGVISASFAIGGTLLLLDHAWGFGSVQLGAPQATLMKLIIEGIMAGNLPWTLVFIGVFIALCVEVVGIPVLPFAIGVYLPVDLSACIMVGGLVRFWTEKQSMEKESEEVNKGILFCSGLIAGEGLMGIVLALLAVLGWDRMLDIGARLGLSPFVCDIFGLVVFLLMILSIMGISKKRREKDDAKLFS